MDVAAAAPTAAVPRSREPVWRIDPRRWPQIALNVVKEAAHDRITSIAGNLAFHGFLTLLPVLIATVGLLGLEGLSSTQLHTLVHDTSELLPNQMSSVINSQLLKQPGRGTSVAEVVVGLFVALWSSVEAMAALQVALDVAYEVPHDRGLLGRRLMAFPLIGVTIVLGGVASVLLVFGGRINHLIPSGLVPLLAGLRYGGSLVLLVLLLSSIYNLGPARGKLTWEWISPGGVVAAGGWVLCALSFSFYLDHFGREAHTYGVLAGVAVTLLWMFLTGVVILVGAEFNRELERVADAPTGGR